MNLKPYMLYSRTAGPGECAMLAFAHTWREARNIGWREIGMDLTDEFTDFTAQLMREADHIMSEADQTKLANDEPHVIDSPTSCERCYMWGIYLHADGLCDGCHEILEYETKQKAMTLLSNQ